MSIAEEEGGVEGGVEEYPHLHTGKSIKSPKLKNPEVPHQHIMPNQSGEFQV